MQRRTFVACAALASMPSLALSGLVETVARTKPSVVLVGTYRETDNPRFQLRGSGFVVGNGRTAVTCAHVLPRQDGEVRAEDLVVQVMQPGGDWIRHPVKVKAVDDSADLALLALDGVNQPPLVLGDSSKVREGEDLAFIGFPIGNLLGYSHVVHRALVSSVTAALLPSPDAVHLKEAAIRGLRNGNYKIFQLDAVAYPGNSGGPLFRPDTGEVVGVMNMVLVKTTREAALSQPSGIAYAVPAARIRELLERSR